jgi:Photosynthesis system II assembly factor YCF48
LGFVVGANGAVMRTFDGGNTWQDISSKIKTPMAIPKEALRFHAVKFADEKYGWIAGRYGIIFATSDGGDSWRLVLSYGVKPAQSVYTINALEVTPQKVWAAGNIGNILVSIDNGHDWIPVHGLQLNFIEQTRRIVEELDEKDESQ